MKTPDLLRHQLINGLKAPPGESVAGAAITFWEQMAAEVISIVGDDGFNSLYARSIYLSQSRFSWLIATPLVPQSDRRFAELKTSLEGQTSAQASEANILLLITFTDILASLIGELLTTRILNLAWSTDISNSTGKEIQK